MLKNIRAYENLHIFLWLLKDTCWIMDFHVGGIIMIVPTVLAAIHITWRWRKDVNEFLHSLAVTCWIFANAIWMIGEFYYDDTLRPYAAPFFIAGLISVGIYYGYVLPNGKGSNHSQSSGQ